MDRQKIINAIETLKDYNKWRRGQLKDKINKFEQKIPNFCAIKVGSYTAYNSFNKIPIIEQIGRAHV